MDATTFYNTINQLPGEMVVFSQPASEKQLKELVACCPGLKGSALIDFLAISNGLMFGAVWEIWGVDAILSSQRDGSGNIGICDVLIGSTTYYWHPSFIYTLNPFEAGRYDVVCQTLETWFELLLEHREASELPVLFTVP